MQLIENKDVVSRRFTSWGQNAALKNYTFVENIRSPLTPMTRALPMLNLALITSAGAYIDGTEPFDLTLRDGDMRLYEIPVEVEAEDLRYAARGYDPKAIQEDRNCQIPIERLLEYQENAVIGSLNNVWWSISSWTPNARRVADELAPEISARVERYGVQAALLIPATRLCHQTLGIVARHLEASGVPTMMLSVDPAMTDRVRPPRTAYWNGEIGSVAGKPNFKEHQLRILDEAIRWIETFDQPGSKKLSVALESQVEAARGER